MKKHFFFRGNEQTIKKKYQDSSFGLKKDDQYVR